METSEDIKPVIQDGQVLFTVDGLALRDSFEKIKTEPVFTEQDEDALNIPCEVLIKTEEDLSECDKEYGKKNVEGSDAYPSTDSNYDPNIPFVFCGNLLIPPLSPVNQNDDDRGEEVSSQEPVLRQNLMTIVGGGTGQNSQTLDATKHLKINQKNLVTCEVCQKTFPYRSELKKHKRTHSEERPFQCTKCPSAFKRKNALQKHWSIHTGEKPFTCTKCDFRCSQLTSLQRHARIHTGEKPYRCSVCSRCFAHLNTLKLHSKTHKKIRKEKKKNTRKKVFECNDCGKGFCRKDMLADHMKIHTEEDLLECNDCGKVFVHRITLLGHQRICTRQQEKTKERKNSGNDRSNSPQ